MIVGQVGMLGGQFGGRALRQRQIEDASKNPLKAITMLKFKAVSTYLFFWPIVVKTPDPDKPGELVESTFEAQFEMPSNDERVRMEREIAENPAFPDETAREVEFLKRVMKGWRGIDGQDDQDLPFTPETVHAVLQFPFVRKGLFVGFFQAVNGNAAKLGN